MDAHADQKKTVISKGGPSTSNDRSAKVKHHPSRLTNSGGNESRDDGDHRLPSSPRQTSQTDVSSWSLQNKSARGGGAPRPPKAGRPPSPQHRKNAAVSNDNGHLAMLRAEQRRLTEKLKELEAMFESVQKNKAYEKSSFLMKRGQLLAEIEGLREDKFFLKKKRDKLGEKLLGLHVKRLDLLESAKQKAEEDKWEPFDSASVDGAAI